MIGMPKRLKSLGAQKPSASYDIMVKYCTLTP